MTPKLIPTGIYSYEYDDSGPGLRPIVVVGRATKTPKEPGYALVGEESTEILPANASRTGLVITNLSENIVSLSGVSPAVALSGIPLFPSGGTWVMDANTFMTGAIYAIAAGADSRLAIQEFE